jgi:outer membrane cobalamin receptor
LAQNAEVQPLDSVLLLLEKQYDIVFTYADENIKDIFVILPNKNLSLDKCLLNLEKQTKLGFKKLNSRYVAIQNYVIVRGVVLNKSDKKPIEEVFIYSGNNYAVSDSNGMFSLKLIPKKDSVFTVRHTAYKQVEQKLINSNKDTFIIELVPKIKVIGEVAVPYLVEGIGKLPDGSIEFNVSDVEVLPGLSEPDVLRTIQVLPGIQSINETVSDINTRGGTNDQTLVLWDDVKMYQTGHFFGLISAFNSHLINKVCIVKNGTSAAYDEGVSGMIDMQMQESQVAKPEASIGLNMLSTDAIIKTPLSKKLSLIAGARHSINELVATPTYEKYYERAFKHTLLTQNQTTIDTVVSQYHKFSFYDLTGKLLYDISENNKLSLSLLKIYNNIESGETAIILDTLYDKKSKLNQSSLLANFSFAHNWSENQTLKFSAFISKYRLKGLNSSEFDNLNHQQINEVLDWGLKLNSKIELTPKIIFSNGYEFKETGIRNGDNIQQPSYNRDTKEVLRIHSIYSEAELRGLLKKLYLRAGLRADYFTKFSEISLQPRLALNYVLNKYFSLELQAEKKSQHTTQLIDYQTDFLGIEKRRWTLANNDRVPLLKSRQFSLGVQYGHKEFLVLLGGYVKQVTGIISPSQGFQNQFQYVYAIGEYSARGIELLVNNKFNRLNTWMNYTLAKNDYYFYDLTPSIFPNNLDIRHALTLGGSYSFNSFVFSCGVSYKTGKPYTRPSENSLTGQNEIMYQTPNSSRLKDYIRVDLSAKYNFSTKKVNGEFGFSIWNLFNRENDINIYHQLSENKQIEQIAQHALGFTPNLNLRLSLNASSAKRLLK